MCSRPHLTPHSHYVLLRGKIAWLDEKKVKMAPVLKLHRHNAKKEIEFELRYLKSLSIKERFKMMSQKTKEMLRLLEKSGHRRPFKIIKRT